MLSKIRHYVPKEELRSIYHAKFSSHLTYNCEVWGQSNNMHISKICKLQNKAMRIINFQDFNAPSKPLYIENKMLRFEDIIRLKNCLFVHDFLNNSLPRCFLDYFTKLNEFYEYYQTRSSNLGLLFVPSKKTVKYGIESITYKSINCWNTISHKYNINLSTLSRDTIKSKLTLIFTHELCELI